MEHNCAELKALETAMKKAYDDMLVNVKKAQDAANETGTQVAIIADDSVVPSDDQVLFLASPVPNA